MSQVAHPPVPLGTYPRTPGAQLADDVRVLRAVINAGPTPGPWGAANFGPAYQQLKIVPRYERLPARPANAAPPYSQVAVVPHDQRMPWEQAVATAEFISACTPERIARLLDRLAQLEAHVQGTDPAADQAATGGTTAAAGQASAAPVVNTSTMPNTSAVASTSADLASLIARADAAVKAAGRSCGQSDVLFESLLQPALAGILADAPADLRAQLEPELRRRGYDPDHEPYQPGPDECGTTGIHVHHCPCGRHE